MEYGDEFPEERVCDNCAERDEKQSDRCLVPWVRKTEVRTKDDAQRLFAELVKTVGLGFHLDTRAEDYVFNGTGKRVFDDADATIVDSLIGQACRVLNDQGIDPYEEALGAMKPLLAEPRGSSG